MTDEIAARIKEARIRKGYTQKKLGELCGYDASTADVAVRQWEMNRRPVPMDKLRKLAEVLDLTLDQLIP